MHKEISAVWIIILSKKLGGWGFQRAWDSSKFGVFEDQQGEKRVCRRVRGSMVGKEVDRIQGPNQVTPWGLQQELWLDPKYDEKPLEDVSRGVMSFGFLFFFLSVFYLLYGEQIAGAGMGAGQRLEVIAAVQAEMMMAGTQWVIIKLVRCSPILNMFLLTIIRLNIYSMLRAAPLLRRVV